MQPRTRNECTAHSWELGYIKEKIAACGADDDLVGMLCVFHAASPHTHLHRNYAIQNLEYPGIAPSITMSAKYDIHVLRSPVPLDELRVFAIVLRDLRLQSLKDSPESFTEKHDAVAARPAGYWQAFITNHTGLIHIAFGVLEPHARRIHAAVQDERTKLIMQHGRPLAMGVNTGPIPRERFLCPPDSRIPPNRADEEEQRFHGSMLFHVPDMRGRWGTKMVQQLILDRDEWLLDSLRSTKSEIPPLARFRGNIKPGSKQDTLLAYYDRAGWYIAGTQRWRSNLVAEGGVDAVRAAEERGDNMDERSVVVEKIFTVAHLEWNIAQNKRLLQQQDARL